MDRQLKSIIQQKKNDLQETEREINSLNSRIASIENHINRIKYDLQQEEYNLNIKERKRVEAYNALTQYKSQFNYGSSAEARNKIDELSTTYLISANEKDFQESKVKLIKDHLKSSELLLEGKKNYLSSLNSKKSKQQVTICNLEAELRQVERDNSASSSRGFRP